MSEKDERRALAYAYYKAVVYCPGLPKNLTTGSLDYIAKTTGFAFWRLSIAANKFKMALKNAAL